MVVDDYTALISGGSINGTVGKPVFYSYSFPEEAPAYLYGAYPAEALATFQTFTRAEREMARDALDAFASVSGLQFFEVKPGEGDINFLKFDMITFAGYAGASTFAYLPTNDNGQRQLITSDIFFDYRFISLNWGNIVHEIGHAVGLKHPWEGDVTLDPALDTKLHTVMSYQGGFGSPPYGSAAHLDEDAVRYLYGENSQDGTQVQAWSWDASAMRLTLTGSAGNDEIAGIGGSNIIHGLDGDDVITAGYGASQLHGDGGNDTITGQGPTDFFGGDGDDVIRAETTTTSASAYGLVWDGDPGNVLLDSQISNRGKLPVLRAANTISGGDGNDDIEVNSLFDLIDGGEGNDTIRVFLSSETMELNIDGSGGRDVLRVYPWALDTQYHDLSVNVSASNASLDNLEEIAISGGNLADHISLRGFSYETSQLAGRDGADYLKGGDGADTLLGDQGNDSLDGGPGTDQLNGGDGSDTIFESEGNDIIDGGPGNDQMVFTGNFDDYRIARTANGNFAVERNATTSQTLISIEVLRFSDGDYFWDSQTGRFVDYNNSGPVATGGLAVTLDEDTTIDVSASFSDADGDGLSYEVSAAAHGTVVQLTNGAFRYYPDRNYNGPDQFTITAFDAFLESATQDVAVTVRPVDDLPVTIISPQTPFYANGHRISAIAGRPTEITVWAREVDGETLHFAAGAPFRGTLSGGENGSFTYVAQNGYVGFDGFNVTVTDEHGGSVSHYVTVEVSEPRFRLFATGGFTGSIAGSGTIFGTTRPEEIFLAYNEQEVSFDPTFARGNDVIHLPGEGSYYNVHLDGSDAVLTFSSSEYRIPFGSAGIPIHFDDGPRILRYDAASGEVMLGSQVIEPNVLRQLVAPPDSTPPAFAGDTTTIAKVFLEPGAEVTLGGDYRVFGTTGAERVGWRSGDIVLDPTFARGGDSIVLSDPAALFTARLAGPDVILQSFGGSIRIPVGSTGLTLDFPGEDDRIVLFNGASVTIGEQVMTTSSAALIA